MPADCPVPIAIVMHMPVGYTEMYAQSLNALSPLKVIEASEGHVLQAGVVLLAPAGRHLSLQRAEDGQVRAHLDARPFDTPHRPSVDVLFRSAAEVYGSRVLGVVMTGMGSDGRQGAAWIKAQGGLVCLPHGFDPLKVHRLQPAALARTIADFDIIEGFNARISNRRWNEDAAKYAAAYLSGQQAPSHPDTEQTFAEVRARMRPADDYPRLGAELAALDRPTMIVQEGGYCLDVLGRNVVGVLRAFG